MLMDMLGSSVGTTLICASITTDNIDKCKEIIYNSNITSQRGKSDR